MKFRRGILTLLVVALNAFTLAPISAAAAAPSAPSAAKSTTPKTVPVTGTITNAPGTFSGVLNLTSFAVNSAGALVANGTLTGTVTDTAGNVLATVSGQAVQVPVNMANTSGTCQILHLDLGPLDLTLLGLHIHLNEVVLDITAQQGGGLLGDLLCGIANLLNGGSLTDLAGLLNQVVGLVQNLFQNLTATGTALVSGTLNGIFTLNRVAVQNGQLVGIGTLTGTITNLLGQVIGAVTNTAVTLPLTASGTCQILHLDLGPLDLTLLGLHVHLNEVVLDITAQQGGGLLGDLLCGVANLLNSGAPFSAIAQVLNRILALF
jgi:hypothetical protein